MAPTLRQWPLLPGVLLRERRYEPGGMITRHDHGHTTLIAVLDGELRERCEGRVIRRRPGELHVLPSDTPHSTLVDAAGARVFLVLLSDEWLNAISERRRAVARTLCAPRGTRAAALSLEMYDEFRSPDAAAPLWIEGLLLETLGTLLRVQATSGRCSVPPWLGEVRDRLREQFTDPPAISDLAACVGVSPGHLYRAFRARFDCTPGEYVRSVRIHHAKRALSASRKPIAQIAHEAGFSDQAHLTRSFHTLVGVTPGTYRRLHGRGLAG